ncbi:hypothetical protein BDY19DRAFT_992477 [Irpex rosettiformis]|uniref:Uncharacterized protein n=1 Tax=Irpex rosettiformis TaxID=378272 RepID=A0ACB8U812_9APHY|nr:hypothetical protein BDY19DRAFT_992477 [Irpex rosettiformis]
MRSGSFLVALATTLPLLPLVSGHASIFTNGTWGLHVTQQTRDWDARLVAPLYGLTFDKWWFHGALDDPPPDGDFTYLPAGGTATLQIACDIGFTEKWRDGPGGDNRRYNDPSACPGQATTIIHANNRQDVAGTALAITYKSDVNSVQPEDFTIISVLHDSVWNLWNDYQIPAGLQQCPEGGCICAWFWIHRPDSGSEQMYMTGFRCKVTGQTGSQPLGKPSIARYCEHDATNCTVGATQPMYWYQAERNNMFENQYDAPTYDDRYGWHDGAQTRVFEDGHIAGGNDTPASTPSPTSSSISSPSSTPASSGNSSGSSDSNSGSESSGSSEQAQSPSPSPQQAAAQKPPSSDTSVTLQTSPTQANTPASPAAATTAVANPLPTTLTASPVTIESPSSTPKKCKRRPKNKKRARSVVKRHLHKRVSHEGLFL